MDVGMSVLWVVGCVYLGLGVFLCVFYCGMGRSGCRDVERGGGEGMVFGYFYREGMDV